MWNEPSKERLAKIPRLYETEETPLQEKLIHLHFFIGACDWFIVEYDGEDVFWGFVILNGDYEMAEWGYISLNELKSISVNGIEIDCEVEEAWKVRRAAEVDKIRIASGWVSNCANRGITAASSSAHPCCCSSFFPARSTSTPCWEVRPHHDDPNSVR